MIKSIMEFLSGLFAVYKENAEWINAIVPLLIAGVSFLVFSSVNRKVKQIINAHNIQDKSEIKRFKRTFRAFINPIIQTTCDGASVQCTTLAQFIKHAKRTSSIFLTGSGGSGKSIYMQHLACRLRRTLFHIQTDSIYRPFANTVLDLDVFLSDIKEEVKESKCSTIWLLLDGLDELKEFNDGGCADKLLSKIQGNIRSWKFPNKTVKLVVSSRAEVFENTRKPSEALKFQVFEIQGFSTKQILRLYKKSSNAPFYENGGTHEKRLKKNLGAMKRHLKGCSKSERGIPESVFSTPFLIQYADILFEESADVFEYETMYSVLRKVIYGYWLEREYTAYRKNYHDADDGLGKEKYLALAKEYLRAIAKVMVESKQFYIHKSDMPPPPDSYICTASLISRHMMVRIEDRTGFIHKSIFEFIVAEHLSNHSFNFAERAEYLLKQEEAPPVIPQKIYAEALYNNATLYKKLADSVAKASGDYSSFIAMEDIVLAENAPLCAREVLDYMVYAKTYTCCGFFFGADETDDFRTQGSLDLEGKHIKDLSFIKQFGKVTELYLEGNDINSIGEYPELADLKVLSLCGNPFSDFEQLRIFDFEELRITVSLEDDLLTVAEKVRFERLIVDIQPMSSIYCTVFDLRESKGLDIRTKAAIQSARADLIAGINSDNYTHDLLRKAYIVDCSACSNDEHRMPLWTCAFFVVLGTIIICKNLLNRNSMIRKYGMGWKITGA